MLFWLHTGVQWRDLPERYGPWQTVYSRFRRWSRDGLWDRILAVLQRDLDAVGKIEWTVWCIDGSNVRAHKAAARGEKNLPPNEPCDHALGRSRGGFGSKVHLLTDSTGLPLAVAVSPGQAAEMRFVSAVLDQVRIG